MVLIYHNDADTNIGRFDVYDSVKDFKDETKQNPEYVFGQRFVSRDNSGQVDIKELMVNDALKKIKAGAPQKIEHSFAPSMKEMRIERPKLAELFADSQRTVVNFYKNFNYKDNGREQNPMAAFMPTSLNRNQGREKDWLFSTALYLDSYGKLTYRVNVDKPDNKIVLADSWKINNFNVERFCDALNLNYKNVIEGVGSFVPQRFDNKTSVSRELEEVER